MNKIIAAIVIALLSLFILIATCPDKQAHRERIKDEVSAYMAREVWADTPEEDTGMAVLGSMLVGTLTDAFLNAGLQVDHYFVCSVGRLNAFGKSRTVSFGVLGHVFVFSKQAREQQAPSHVPDEAAENERDTARASRE